MSVYKRYRDHGNNAVADYKAKCALAERLGDVALRQWCVEQIGVCVGPNGLEFGRVSALFNYIKGEKTG